MGSSFHCTSVQQPMSTERAIMTMNNRVFAGILASASLISAAANAADTPKVVDAVKAAVTPGELVLTGHEVKNIHNGDKSNAYRICVKAEKDSAPAKVTVDGKPVSVAPGGCSNVDGKKIDVTPEAALTGSKHIVVTFHETKGK